MLCKAKVAANFRIRAHIRAFTINDDNENGKPYGVTKAQEERNIKKIQDKGAKNGAQRGRETMRVLRMGDIKNNTTAEKQIQRI